MLLSLLGNTETQTIVLLMCSEIHMHDAGLHYCHIESETKT